MMKIVIYLFISLIVSVNSDYYQISNEICNKQSDEVFDEYLMPCAIFSSDNIDFGDCLSSDETYDLLETVPLWTYNALGDYGIVIILYCVFMMKIFIS